MPLFRPDDIKLETGVEDTVFGKYRARMFRNAGGLTQFGAFIEVLMPGSYSSKLHWHSSEDEMIHVPAGSVTLIEGDNLEILRPGDTACFRAGTPVGHCLHNHTDASVSYMVAGTRSRDDVVTDPETGETATKREFIKTCRDAAGNVLRTVPVRNS